MDEYPNYIALSDTTTGGDVSLPLTNQGDLLTRNATTDIRLPVGSSGQVLTTDGTDVSWGAVAGTGNVVGPLSNATDGNVALFDGTTGKLLKDSLLLAKQDASRNTIIGGTSISLSGVQNTLIGDNEYAITTGSSNVGLGMNACDNISSASQCTGIGHSALTSTTTAGGSTAIGSASLQLSTGSSNTAIGANSGNTISSASNSTFCGADSDGAATLSNQTALGYQATSDKSNQIMLGNSSVTEIVPNASASVNLGSSGKCFTSAFLKDIAEPSNAADAEGILFKKTGDDGIWWKPDSAGSAVDLTASGGGGSTTASNVGTAGVGVFKQKSANDLEFKKINAGSSKITITDDTGNDEVDIDVAEANLSIASTQLTGQVAIANGGTGAATATAGFDALAPTTSQGDISYHNGTNNVRLAKGTASQVLTMNAGATAPEWATPSGGGSTAIVPNIVQRNYVTGASWLTSSATEANSWNSVCWSPELGLFCAVSYTGTNRVMTSPDGITWTARSAAEPNGWRSVCWSPELGLFCAVSTDGTNRVMTSPDGITWTARSAAEANGWYSVCWSPELGLFCAVSYTGTNRVMTSPDGITWTARSAAEANGWFGVCWSPELGLFCAVSISGTNLVMTSVSGYAFPYRS